MARERTKHHIGPKTRQDDQAVITALQNLPGYAPRNPNCSPAALLALEAAAQRDRRELRASEEATQALRKRSWASDAAVHASVLEAKTEVRAQYGENSAAMLAIGLKPRSDRKRPQRKAARGR
ncbi:MAG TPA: hypothetical protein PKD53_07665 [Chloroflexaceae bacterium]|nr:hypothetical protein [Chloroflexaceae bacterium]